VCIRNDGYEAPLERRKIYHTITDADATDHKHLRVIDESGEDSLYPAEYFMLIELPASIQQAMSKSG